MLLVLHMRRPIRMLGIATFATSLVAGGCDGSTASTPVGPRGGIVASQDGVVVLDVPPGAMQDTVALSIVPAPITPQDAVGPTYTVEPFGIAFALPASVAYDLAACTDDDPVAFRLVTERARGWDPLADPEIDLSQSELRGSVMATAAIAPITTRP